MWLPLSATASPEDVHVLFMECIRIVWALLVIQLTYCCTWIELLPVSAVCKQAIINCRNLMQLNFENLIQIVCVCQYIVQSIQYVINDLSI